MGQYMGIYNYIDKKNDSNIHESNEEKIQKIYEEIYALKIRDEPNIIDELIISYEKLFDYKNTNE